MKTITLKIFAISVFLLFNHFSAIGQCANSSNVYSFVYDGKTYEVIKENKTWIDASACAVERGGILAEINDAEEQNAIFNEISTNAGVNASSTVAPDGGGASYLWIGGNDLSVEGNWVWDGNNDNDATQFWMGDLNGTPVGGLYNNWGNEPDDFGSGQDGLGLAITDWPLGIAGEWNDVSHTNMLYYVVEYSTILSVNSNDINDKINFYPNPFKDFLVVNTNDLDLSKISIYNAIGQEMRIIDVKDNTSSISIDLSDLSNGVYFIKVIAKNGESFNKKVFK